MQKIPILIELLFNGVFIIFYLLSKYYQLPSALSAPLVDFGLDLAARFVPFVIFFIIIINYLQSHRFEDFFRKHIFSFIVFVPLLITWGDLEFCFWLSSIHLLSSFLTIYENGNDQQFEELSEIDLEKYKNKLSKAIQGSIPLDIMSGYQPQWLKVFALQPAQIVFLTFALLIFLGTCLMALPISSISGKSIPLIDSFFMATSATCVTGLATISLKSDLSMFGQLVLLILAQVGGLGIMILYSSMTILLGKSMAMRERIIMQDLLDVGSLEELINIIVDIVKYTLVIEFWGAIVLTIGFLVEGFEFGKALYFGFYHSIMAFCNAGLALFDNNLESFASKPLIQGTICILIILGGIGFSVLKEIKLILSGKLKISRLSLHSKVTLVTTGILIFAGALIIFFGEFLNALDGYTFWGKVQVALFQSITTRTAGFNTLPLTNLHAHTLYMMCMLMFIGAGSGSTAGGIKVSTFAILIQSIRSTLRGRESVEMFDRTIPNTMVVKTTALTIISLITCTLFIFILMKIESNQSFLSIFFETISAFGTVGLSLGITPYLSALGKIMVSVLMFIGRIGPLTLVLAIGQQKRDSGRFEYPPGRIVIG